MTTIITKTCTKCGIEKSTLDFYNNSITKDKLTSWCKECSHINTKNYIKKNSTKYTSIIKNRWNSINQRCVNGKYSKSTSVQYSPQFQSYHKKNISINMTKEEFTNWMLSVEQIHNDIVSKGEKSSIDRIDESKGYEIGNLQLISLHSNIEKRYKTTCKIQPKEQKDKVKVRNQKYYLKNKGRINGN